MCSVDMTYRKKFSKSANIREKHSVYKKYTKQNLDVEKLATLEQWPCDLFHGYKIYSICTICGGIFTMKVTYSYHFKKLNLKMKKTREVCTVPKHSI